MSFSLKLYESVLRGQTFQADLSERAEGWRRSTRAQGGYWMGSFDLLGSERDLIQAFQAWLGMHIEERAGGAQTWEGMIYEMDLTLGGVRRRRSLDAMWNHVIAVYDNSGTPTDTSAASNAASVEKYGRREARLNGASGFAQTAAENYRDSYLKEFGFPGGRAVGLGGRKDSLEVTVAGYIHTAGWRYESAGDGSDDDLDDWLSEIVGTDCEFLTELKIEANTMTVAKDTANPSRAWEVLKLLAGLGDASGNRYRIHVGNQRYISYEQISMTPAYYLKGGELYTAQGTYMGQPILKGGAESQWTVKPGVVRDFRYAGGDDYEGWLESGKDFYLDEVEASVEGITLKTADYEESEILANQQRYKALLERMRD